MLKRPRVAYYFTNEQDKADVSQRIKAVAEGRIPSNLSQEFGGSSSLLNSHIIILQAIATPRKSCMLRKIGLFLSYFDDQG